jgi:RNA polymerase sigma-B factor
VTEHRRDEQQLFRERSRDPAARDALIERYLPLAHSLARRYMRGAEPVEDLEQVAALALIRAIDMFDAELGIAFSSYAVPSIAGALKRHYRDVGWTVRPPRRLQQLALDIRQAHDDLRGANGTEPTAGDIAAYVGASVEDVLEAREAYTAMHSESLDRPRKLGDGEAAPLIETIGDRDGEIRRAFERVTLEALLDTLDERQRTIVKLYYQDELTQSEIGNQLGYSQMHVSRLLRRAVEKLLLAASAPEARI